MHRRKEERMITLKKLTMYLFYKQSFLALCMCLTFFGARAMDLVNTRAMDSVIELSNYPTNDPTDRVISMHDCWAQDYTNNINAVKNIDLDEMVANLHDAVYLPDDANSLEHLLYLSTIQKGNEEKTPFSRKQQHKFNTAFNTRKRVPICFLANGVIIAVTALFGYTSLVALSQCSQTNQTNCVSQTSAIVIPTTITCVGTLLVGFSSLYATGILPDVSARKADKIQDKIGNLSSKYLTLAKYWIDIYFMYPDKAIDIAKRFDMDALQARIKAKTRNAKSGGRLVNPLKEAWHFIIHKHILVTFTEIESYLYSKMNAQRNEVNAQQIVSLSKRIDELEHTIHEQDKKICELTLI